MAVYSNLGNETENYLEGCQPNMSVIPKYATLDEMAFHIIEASETDFNKMMVECGVEELYHLEESKTEMIYEEGKIAALKDKAVKFFKDLWEKVQRMFNNAIEWFQKKAKEFRNKFMEKLDKSFLKNRVSNIPADKAFGTTYDYQNITTFSSRVVDKIKTADAAVDELCDEMESKQKNEKLSVESYDNEIQKIVNKCLNDVSISVTHQMSNTSGLTKIMKTKIRGTSFQVTGSWVKSNFYSGVNIYKEVLEYPTTKIQLKKDYKELQKSFNEAIKKCKKTDNGKMFEATAFTKAIKGYKMLRQISVYSQQAVISCLNERYSFFRSVMFKLIGVKKASSDSKAVGESTTVDSISSLFDWD